MVTVALAAWTIYAQCQINRDKGATQLFVAMGILVIGKTLLTEAFYSKFLNDALRAIWRYMNFLKSSLSLTKWQSGKGCSFCSDGNAQGMFVEYQMQHGVRPFPGLERTMAIQITGILCWTLLCEVILTEYYFPERAVADNLTAWKISRVKYDGALLSEIPMEGMREQSRTRCWRDTSILGSWWPLKMKHGRIF